MYYKKVEGERIYLSPMCMEDAEKYTKWMNDLKVTDGINNSRNVINLESEKKWIEENSKFGNYNFSIVKKDNNELIGNCSFHDLDKVYGNATVGIFIGEEENRGKGNGTEALKLLIGYGFDYLNLNNIMLTVNSFNEGAIKCYKKVGFKEFGKRRNSVILKNKRYDTIYMDIIREEYYKEWYDGKSNRSKKVK